jgi:hypothetical protein
VISVGALPVNSSAADGPKWLLIKILAALNSSSKLRSWPSDSVLLTSAT